ncbi:hypothetical protein C8Q70DRAFT_400247 [Cubamyces menziesii]|uniref:Uncharacterized protein n=1 Tax=Trametes cubensis TaxID=1111947 RepID=A0AAD7X9P3_9APHY|nr:hypothetical protein C8Q70DRAFT_400247 [Cubamyces menziesii]KAJ8473278.1 hypothetical protein ONZ51_g7976 [Trametes cubensis]
MSPPSSLFDALLNTIQTDIPESHNPVDIDCQTTGSVFDAAESFFTDFGLHPGELAGANDVLPDAPDCSVGAFELELDAYASLDAYGHVDPYIATGILGPIPQYDPIHTQVAPGHPTFEDIPAAPPLSYYGNVWGLFDLDNNYWQQSIYVEPQLPVLQQEATQVQGEIVPTESQVTAVQPPARPCKRKARVADEEIWPTRPKKTRCVDEDSQHCRLDAHRSWPTSPTTSLESFPSSPFTSSSRSTPTSPLSPSRTQGKLRPIVVEPPQGLHCPMAGCGIRLPPKDSAWRGHFRAAHHMDICADARAGSCTGTCKHTCPLPTHYKCAVPMAVDSIGRHFLNVHFELHHRCPVCGAEKAQRYSSCQRHIDICAKKQCARE